jgi:hypothetical protein
MTINSVADLRALVQVLSGPTELHVQSAGGSRRLRLGTAGAATASPVKCDNVLGARTNYEEEQIGSGKELSKGALRR